MSDTSSKASFEDYTGKRHDVTIDITDYAEANDHKISLTQLYAQKYPTKEGGADAFDQFLASAGIVRTPDRKRGIPASNMAQILQGAPSGMQMGTLTRTSGADRQSTTGRLLFAEMMLQTINNELISDPNDYLNPWEGAIAIRSSVSSSRADQARISVTGPEASAAMPIGQGALPAVMVSIDLASKSYQIPTKSIGLTITDQAMQSATLDLVGLAMTNQARGERIRRIQEDMGNIISGDTDYGVAATTFANASTFDANGGIDGTPMLTNRAYIKWLRANHEKMQITHILADIDAAIDIEERVGRPTVYNDQSLDANRFRVDNSIVNLGIPSPRIILLPTSIIGANRLVGFDASKGLHELTNVTAGYSATEAFVMRRTTAFRVDFGVILVKLYDEAFTGMTLGA